LIASGIIQRFRFERLPMPGNQALPTSTATVFGKKRGPKSGLTGCRSACNVALIFCEVTGYMKGMANGKRLGLW
jgi:hypothetical protein